MRRRNPLLTAPAFKKRGTRIERIDKLCRCHGLVAYSLGERVFCVCDRARLPDCETCPVRINSSNIPEKQRIAWEKGRAKATAVNGREKRHEWSEGNVEFPSVSARNLPRPT